jgi:hypothetical protein
VSTATLRTGAARRQRDHLHRRPDRDGHPHRHRPRLRRLRRSRTSSTPGSDPADPASVPPAGDTDGDGIADPLDDCPTVPTRASRRRRRRARRRLRSLHRPAPSREAEARLAKLAAPPATRPEPQPARPPCRRARDRSGDQRRPRAADRSDGSAILDVTIPAAPTGSRTRPRGPIATSSASRASPRSRSRPARRRRDVEGHGEGRARDPRRRPPTCRSRRRS